MRSALDDPSPLKNAAYVDGKCLTTPDTFAMHNPATGGELARPIVELKHLAREGVGTPHP
ncbi:hypothetical protein [Streptomyces sp. NPDC048277]|uniref:hypothetical protein n=1 Tax=Streptomyces sp. NPDC048277 TaxID=3155027 RepID=UPI0033D4266C